MSAVFRFAYLSFYGGCAALGVAATARPMALWVRGVVRSSLGASTSVPFGCAFALLGLAIAGCALALAIDVATQRTSSPARHAALLVLVAIAGALRVTVAPLTASNARTRAAAQQGPPPPRDPFFPDYPHHGDRAGRDRSPW